MTAEEVTEVINRFDIKYTKSISRFTPAFLILLNDRDKKEASYILHYLCR
jgi:hypothetical protein